jgi:type I restriction enzyme, R subunit
MNKKSLSERDICTKFITPSLAAAGWNVDSQIREEVGFTDGRIYVRGKLHARGAQKRADYILYYKPNIPIAVIEAKDNNHTIGAGIQQALGYADPLDVPFVFSSNGDGFLFHDKTLLSGPIETEIALNNFPSPDELWQKYKSFKGITEDIATVVAQDYFSDGSKRAPRYYQQIAINRTVEAVARKDGGNRHLLVMATGTGKTYTAFQFIYRLWKSGLKKRILFLADRTALIDQTVRGDFRHFKEAMTVIKHKEMDPAYNIYLALYQGLSDNSEGANDAYKQFSPDFFDLIVVDECHRGSAREDSRWRAILEYFGNATHVGLTATPKETKEVSSSEYFGDPIYTYSLKQGIDDGFLAPYKVIKITLDIDAEGWRPPKGFKDKEGVVVEDRIYNRTDFDKHIVVEERRQAVAKKVTEFLKGSDRFSKTIVFCVDIEHAEGMRRELANANADIVAANSKYVMQITGDNKEGKDQLDAFINPSETYPVIAVTSKLMTTGVDAQTCKLIVLDSNIGSMTEFKQIIGRGTRINEDFGKHYFTIMDFRNVTALFADKEFDGDPVRVKNATEIEDISDTDDEADEAPLTDDITGDVIDFPESQRPDVTIDGTSSPERRRKVTVNGVDVIIIKERVQYMGHDGKIITESLRDYTRKNVLTAYGSLDAFLRSWKQADKKRVMIDELERHGVIFSALNEEVGSAFDPFDLICHVAFEQKPLTRKERADKVKKRDYFTKYGDLARSVISALLDKYSDDGLLDLENPEIIRLDPLRKLGSPVEIIRSFGGKSSYDDAIHSLTNELYKVA